MFGKSYINKIFIDSRHKTSASASDSDFVVELNENIELSDGIGCIVTDITLPHTWYNVNENNNIFYFRTVVNSISNDYLITLPVENYNFYNLRDRLLSLMNDVVSVEAFDVQVYVQAGTLTISVLLAGWTLQVFNDNDLSTRVSGTWRGPFYDVSNIKSVNTMLRINALPLRSYNSVTPSVTGFVDLLAFHSVYLTSTKLSNYCNLGPASQRNVLKKVVVSSNFGEVNTNTDVWSDDRVNVSNLTLKLIDFQLRDAYGNVINLNGSHVTFSLLFVKM